MPRAQTGWKAGPFRFRAFAVRRWRLRTARGAGREGLRLEPGRLGGRKLPEDGPRGRARYPPGPGHHREHAPDLRDPALADPAKHASRGREDGLAHAAVVLAFPSAPAPVPDAGLRQAAALGSDEDRRLPPQLEPSLFRDRLDPTARVHARRLV